eukprot:CAMPEP_0178534824 /NCGR_PEP_ID=MMETSP0696-20121128/35230_1 /TAXON_ID=265572 /ORGANISM="Extubocellulus spinifer, Strain CCMP396" /LENGTH=57 /DNA_ID=CAMNT_0020166947 /DNA_START=103 /DNA_END=276 /DNA_ORIENTATION=-
MVAVVSSSDKGVLFPSRFAKASFSTVTGSSRAVLAASAVRVSSRVEESMMTREGCGC